MQKVVCQIIANVAKNTTTIYRDSSVPVVEENGMSELPERRRQHNEESWWHDQSVLIHREVMVNAMEKEVKCDSYTVVWKVPTEVSFVDVPGMNKTYSSRWKRVL